MKILQYFGLKRIEADVYIYLEKNGPLNVKKLCIGLELSEKKLHRVLKNLQDRALVSSNIKHPNVYFAMAIEEVLERYVKLNLEEAKKINRNKKELIARWQSFLN